jgi:hypothetical protein
MSAFEVEEFELFGIKLKHQAVIEDILNRPEK